MKKVSILLSNDVFAGILIKPLVKKHPEWINTVYVENTMTGNRTPLQTFLYVIKKSGFSYAFYQAIELITYQFLAEFKSKLRRKVSILPVRLAKARGIPVVYFDSKNWSQVVSKMESERPDVLLCVRFGKILKKDILNIPTFGAINFHGSLLPKYAGLGSILQAVRFKEPELGGTFHTMTDQIDTGLILSQDRVFNQPFDSVSSLQLKIYKECSKSVEKVISDLIDKKRKKFKTCEREIYFSFPEIQHVKEATKIKKLMKLADIKTAWEIF